MKNIQVGSTFTLEEQVTEEKSAHHIGSGILNVYSTPSMIALMEKASYLCVENYLDEQESTVGGSVNIRHLKPTAIGKKVACTSRVVASDGKRIEFEVEVREGEKLIGKGTHTRFVVEKERFLKMS